MEISWRMALSSPLYSRAGGDLGFQGFPRLFRSGGEKGHPVRHCFRQVEGPGLQRRRLLVHAGQGHQFSHHLGHELRLFPNVAEPLAGPGLAFQNVQVGPDQGEGRFQLVVGVGDELLLPLVAFRNRLYRPFGKQGHQQKHHQAAPHKYQGGCGEKVPVHAQCGGAADAHHHRLLGGSGDLKAVAAHPAPLTALVQGLLSVVGGFLLGDACDGLNVRGEHLSLGVKPHGEKPGGKRRFRVLLCGELALPAVGTEGLGIGEAAVVFRENVRQVVQGAGGLQVGGKGIGPLSAYHRNLKGI